MSVRPTSIRAIIQVVARQRGVSERLICSARRDRETADARHIVYWLAREVPGHSSRLIGDALHRDASSVLTGAAALEERRLSDPALAAELAALKAQITSSANAHVARMLADPDPVAAAERIATSIDPIRAGIGATAVEIASIARRAVALEGVAAATFELLARTNRALALDGEAAREHAAGTQDLVHAIAEALEALGYADAQQEEEKTGEHANA